MKTAVIFASKHGATEKIANRIAKNTNADIFKISQTEKIDLQKYDQVIVGSPIYAGAQDKRIAKFAMQNEADLLGKKLRLFVVGMQSKAAKKELATYPEALRKHAIAAAFFEGAFDFAKMNFMEKMMIRKITGVTESVSKIDFEKVDHFCA